MAVRVVRSIASSVATDPIVGGSGRFNDISSENWPLVRPAGRSASSKRRDSARAARRAARQRQWSRTCRVVSKGTPRSEEHTSELQSLMRISYAVFCLKKKKKPNKPQKIYILIYLTHD